MIRWLFWNTVALALLSYARVLRFFIWLDMQDRYVPRIVQSWFRWRLAQIKLAWLLWRHRKYTKNPRG